jgi:hypothetical protein
VLLLLPPPPWLLPLLLQSPPLLLLLLQSSPLLPWLGESPLSCFMGTCTTFLICSTASSIESTAVVCASCRRCWRLRTPEAEPLREAPVAVLTSSCKALSSRPIAVDRLSLPDAALLEALLLACMLQLAVEEAKWGPLLLQLLGGTPGSEPSHGTRY